MRKLSILLLLIGLPFMIIKANSLSTQRTKIIRWHKCQKTPNSIPIEAIQDEHSIEVRFLENIDGQVTFQVKDQQGNIIFQDVLLAPNEQETYKINLEDYPTGHYELLYIEEDMTLIGEFDIG
ncbi:DUF3244 domain-containing protein [Bacteroides acidifaciens]|uniref:DUF3244 domain-containing protein n=1 Tax=Bacteroides acidifaciens TaxID=85831 RepID=A0A3L7Z9T7_9BACE|nr:DUF3244 domain-containing protein [Bacteroides acidifaciens]RLT80959.1 DUF3244 domain-containing protein [Bacteroides acidifaciens]